MLNILVENNKEKVKIINTGVKEPKIIICFYPLNLLTLLSNIVWKGFK